MTFEAGQRNKIIINTEALFVAECRYCDYADVWNRREKENQVCSSRGGKELLAYKKVDCYENFKKN